MFSALTFRILPLAAMFGLGMLGVVAGPGWSTRMEDWPWIVSLVVVGLPHGAVDYAVARRLLSRSTLFAAGLAYLAAVLIAAIGFLTLPRAAVAGFVAWSSWHFGLARGGLAVGVPLVVWPGQTGRIAAEVGAVAGAAVDFDPAAIRAAGLLLVAVGLVAIARETARAVRSRGGWRSAGRPVVEAGIIGLLAATTSPLFSVGIHFLVWHAWREMRPLARAIGGRSPRDLRSLAISLRGIHAAALPLLVPTWVACAVACWLLPAPRLEHSAHGVAILSLVTYLIVTPAHAVARQWARGGARHHPGEASAHGVERAGRRGLQMPSAPV